MPSFALPDKLKFPALALALLTLAGTGAFLWQKYREAPNACQTGNDFCDVFVVGGEVGPGFGPAVGPIMVPIPQGSFMMGSPESEPGRSKYESPQHQVTIAAPFALGKTPVTFAEWDACVKDGGCGGYLAPDEGWGRGNRPVIHVNWDNAQEYVKWLSAKTGKRYSLPSEAQWEYAARAKTATMRYWGDSIGGKQANCNGCGSQWDNKRTAPVGSFAPNGFGLHDMLGNVLQLTQDCWHDSYKGAPVNGGEWKDACGKTPLRVQRGGTWSMRPDDVRAANRYKVKQDFSSNGIGFRVARTLP